MSSLEIAVILLVIATPASFVLAFMTALYAMKIERRLYDLEEHERQMNGYALLRGK